MIARSRNIQLGLILAILATALSLSLLATAADAYSPEQEQMCTGDALRLCGSDVPDVDRVTACMVRQRSQLSPGCRAFFRDSERELTPVAARRRPVYRPHTAGKTKKSRKPQ